MTCGSLFAGIGGFDLGFERAGIKTIWQVEIDEYCRRVLAKHFPDAERFGDIRECGAHNLKPVDIISGGFPCQDISLMGDQVGIEHGKRSGLWGEMWRIIRELRPGIVVVENVAALLRRDIGRILADLATSGYDAEWDCLPAYAFGALHRRDRVFVLGYTKRTGLERLTGNGCEGEGTARAPRSVAAASLRSGAQEDMANTQEQPIRPGLCSGAGNAWSVEPNVGRVAHGVPKRMERLRALGNAVVPQVAEWIGRRIVEATA